MAGRPSDYNKQIVEEICEQIATTKKGIATILSEKEEYPTEKTWFNWLNNNENKEILQLYARAKERQAERMVEEILEISDETSKDTITTENGEIANNEWISRSRLRVDSRKWLASKLLPKKYGDKLDIDLQTNIIKVIIPEDDGSTPAATSKDTE